MGCPSGRSPPYPRIKLCRAGKTDLSVFILRLLTSRISLAESPSFYLISFCHRISKKKTDSIVIAAHTAWGKWGRGGGGGYPGFQVIGMIEWGQKSKPKKIPTASRNPWTKISPLKNPMLNFRPLKFIRGTTRPGYVGTITNLQIVLNARRNPYLNQAT